MIIRIFSALPVVVGLLLASAMGAYAHPRLLQFVLGGVTDTMLREAKVPVLYSSSPFVTWSLTTSLFSRAKMFARRMEPRNASRLATARVL